MTKLQVAKYCEATTPFSATKYLVVDIGGGTVDISAHQLMKHPQPHINVIHTPTGNDCGGNRINKEFQKFLETLVGDPGFSKFLSTPNEKKNAENRIRISKIIYESFERQKIRFGDRSASKSFKVVVPLDGRFIDTYRGELGEGIARRRDDQVKLDLSDLRISSQLMETFYKPVTDGIIQCIRTTLRDVRQIEKIYLVGGFGGSKYICKVIQESFGNSFKYVVPAEPAFAVIRGAVIYKNTPDVIKSRKVDATYGIYTNSNFIDGLHDKKYLWVDDDGVRKCKCLFSTVVEHGEVVGSEEVCKSTFIPVEHNQTSMELSFFSSEKTDVFYVSEATKVGEVVISMSDLTGDKEREVEAMFDFSHTEIQVKVFDKTSGNEVKTVLDFLTK